MIERLVLMWTHRLWNKHISRILCELYSERVIDSRQLHTITAVFDPTQRHRVYKRKKSVTR